MNEQPSHNASPAEPGGEAEPLASDRVARPHLPGSPAPPAGMARVLVIDDETEIGNAVRAGLSGAHFAVAWVATATQGMAEIARWHPDVVILDLMLPDMDGIAVCDQVRAWSAVPIIVLSVRGGDRDKITALEHGADDYLTKPFSMGELIARIRVALRHAAPATGNAGARFVVDELAIDFERRAVQIQGREVHLTPIEYEVLKYLAMHVGKVVTHQTLLRAVWGPDYAEEIHYLRVFIGQLRRKIEPDPSRPHYILTDPGIGYRLRG